VSLAAELRWSALPPLTYTNPELIVTGILEPAYDIAGDTFDYAVGVDRADIALFDAMGHGLQASRMATLAVAAYRHGRRDGRGLVELVASLDAVIEEGFGDFRFVTAQLARLDTASGRLELANAGHPPGLVLHADGTDEELPGPTTRPLGLGGPPAQVRTVQLRPGDVVLLFTDGVTEARDQGGEVFGVDRLRTSVRASLRARLRPAEVLRVARSEVMRHERPLRDDATLVALVWRPGEDAAAPAVELNNRR
jgi:serine phosphatase RsbU (regulator of sigma subunit)